MAAVRTCGSGALLGDGGVVRLLPHDVVERAEQAAEQGVAVRARRIPARWELSRAAAVGILRAHSCHEDPAALRLFFAHRVGLHALERRAPGGCRARVQERGEVLPIGVREAVQAVEGRHGRTRRPAAVMALVRWAPACGHRHDARACAPALRCPRWVYRQALARGGCAWGCEKSLQGGFCGLGTLQWLSADGAPTRKRLSLPAWPTPRRLPPLALRTFFSE